MVRLISLKVSSLIDEWRRLAVCVGVDSRIFFPEYAQSEKVWTRARVMCNQCPVQRECLEFALQWEDLEDRWGMYAGHTPNERNLIRSERRKWKSV